MIIEVPDVRAIATGTERDDELEFSELSPVEIKKFGAVIKAIRKDWDLLREAGDPILLAIKYPSVHNLLILSHGEVRPKMYKLLEEWPRFRAEFFDDEEFREQFDLAYKGNRLTMVRGYACTKLHEVVGRKIRHAFQWLFGRS